MFPTAKIIVEHETLSQLPLSQTYSATHFLFIFAQTVRIKRVLPQAAHLSILDRKISSVAPL